MSLRRILALEGSASGLSIGSHAFPVASRPGRDGAEELRDADIGSSLARLSLALHSLPAPEL